MSFYGFARGLVSCFCHIAFRVKVEGIENVPKDGEGYIVCANHKSLCDPLLVGAALPVQLNFMAKEELFSNKLFGWVLRALGAFPVSRGNNDIGAMKAAIKVLKGGGRIVIFPEGTRSTKDCMNKGKGGAALIAVKSNVNILPIGIEGRYRIFSKLTVRIGKPLDLSEYFGKKVDSETVQRITDGQIMAMISELSKVPMCIEAE